MRNLKQYRMQFATVVSLIVLVAIPVVASSANALSGQESLKTAPNDAGKTKSDVKAAGIRDHLRLQPVTSEQFRLAAKKGKKSPAAGVRGHLNLQPLTSDDFKSGLNRKGASQPSGSAK